MHNSDDVDLTTTVIPLGAGKLKAAIPPPPVTRPSANDLRKLAISQIPVPATSPASRPAVGKAENMEALIKKKMAEITAGLDAQDTQNTLATARLNIAHLTGTDVLRKLSDAAEKELKEFVASGGTLIVDAATTVMSISPIQWRMNCRKSFPTRAIQLSQPLNIDDRGLQRFWRATGRHLSWLLSRDDQRRTALAKAARHSIRQTVSRFISAPRI